LRIDNGLGVSSYTWAHVGLPAHEFQIQPKGSGNVDAQVIYHLGQALPLIANITGRGHKNPQTLEISWHEYHLLLLRNRLYLLLAFRLLIPAKF
jgi:hypothetical protein